MVKILITCTPPRADDFLSDLKTYNIASRPALIVSKTQNSMPHGNYDAMLLSSRHAVIDDLPNLPVIAVGKKTADLTTSKNLNLIQIGNGGVQDLDLSHHKNILYPCAVEPTFVPKNCIAWPVYKTINNPEFYIDRTDNIICVFSTKAAHIIKTYDLSDKFILCLSQTVADTFEKSKVGKLAVCMRPRYDDMISLILKQVKAHT